MHRSRTRATATACLGAALALTFAGCAGQDGTADSRPNAAPVGAFRQPGPVSPFTGLAARPEPVLAVKIDNVGRARPHTGLAAADLVYVEQVEAGLTRILAVLSSRLPPTVGPVRSARESDLEILRQFGTPALAYSGVQSKLVPLITAAPLVALPPERAHTAYFRGTTRPAPHNLYLRPAQALAMAPGASTARDIGFRFGAAPQGGRRTPHLTVRYPAARYDFTWSPSRGRWLVSMDGADAVTTDAGRLAPATVVIQHVRIRPSRFKDSLGNVTPYTESVGSGTAVVLRDGLAYDARWSRRTPGAGTTFTTRTGQRMTFSRGQVWVMYAPATPGGGGATPAR